MTGSDSTAKERREDSEEWGGGWGSFTAVISEDLTESSDLKVVRDRAIWLHGEKSVIDATRCSIL